MRVVAPLLLLAFGLGCAEESEPRRMTTQDREQPEVIVSFLGEALSPTTLPAQVRANHEAKLVEARTAFVANPEDVDSIIWLGRRLAYLGRYQEAIETFGLGIDSHPDEPRLYRHRGHRYITTRRLEEATADLERAAELIAGKEDQVEPDGLPNSRGIPTSTLQSNIWYHLGLARYLEGDFQSALNAYEACLDVSRNPDMLVATSHWLYMTLRRLGLDEQAQEVLEAIPADLDIIENHKYHQLLLMYRGEIPHQELWPSEGDSVASATLGYGIGNWHLYGGRSTDAVEIFRQILEGDQWASFGYLAAEAEIARALQDPRP